MGVLIDGKWHDGELPQRPSSRASSTAPTAYSATASPRTARLASRRNLDDITSMSRTAAPGRIAR